MYHLVVYESGPAWVPGQARRDQPGWPDHAVFMNRLEDEGAAVLGVPLRGTDTVPVVMRAPTGAALQARIAADPWLMQGILQLRGIFPWAVLLGGFEAGRATLPTGPRGLYFVVRERGPAWDMREREGGRAGSDANPLEATMRGQVGWEAHARFMEELVESDVVLMGGPVTGTDKVALAIRADSQTAVHTRLEQDPWTSSGLLRTTASYQWHILLGGR